MDISTYNKIKEIYYNPSLGLQSKAKLYSKLKNENIKMKDIEQFLSMQQVQQVHQKVKPIKIFFPIYSHHPFEKVQVDLLDVSNLSATNQNIKYILLCIDTYSRYTLYVPLKNKLNETVTNAMSNIIKQINQPIGILQSDLGSEFISSSFKRLMKDHNIKIEYSEVGDHKSLALVNRFCLTIRTLLEKYLTSHNTTKYIDVLDNLIFNYNHTLHRIIGMTPAEALKDKVKILQIMNEKQQKARQHEQTFNIGDSVRYLLNNSSFDKKTLPKWSKTIYKIIEKQKHSYKLDNNKSYMFYELQKVTHNYDLGVSTRTKQHKIQRSDLKHAITVKRRMNKEGVHTNNILKSKRQVKRPQRFSTRKYEF